MRIISKKFAFCVTSINSKDRNDFFRTDLKDLKKKEEKKKSWYDENIKEIKSYSNSGKETYRYVYKKLANCKHEVDPKVQVLADSGRTNWLTKGDNKYTMNAEKLLFLEDTFSKVPYCQTLMGGSELWMHLSNLLTSVVRKGDENITDFFGFLRDPGRAKSSLCWRESSPDCMKLHAIQVEIPKGLAGYQALIITSTKIVKDGVAEITNENLYCVNDWKDAFFASCGDSEFGKLFKPPETSGFTSFFEKLGLSSPPKKFSFYPWVNKIIDNQGKVNWKEKKDDLLLLLSKDSAAKCAMPFLKELVNSNKPVSKSNYIINLAKKHGWTSRAEIFSVSGFDLPTWLNKVNNFELSKLMEQKKKVVPGKKNLILQRLIDFSHLGIGENLKILVLKEYVYIGGEKGLSRIYRWSTKRTLSRLKAITAMAPVKSKACIAVFAENKNLHLLLLQGYELRLETFIDDSIIKDVHCVDKNIFTLSENKIQKWELNENNETLQKVKSLNLPYEATCFYLLEPETPNLNAGVVVVGFANGNVAKYTMQLEQNPLMKKNIGHGKINSVLVFSKWIVICQEGKIHITDIELKNKVLIKMSDVINNNSAKITCLSKFDKTSFVYGREDGKIALVDLSIQIRTPDVATNIGAINSIKVSRFGRTLIVASKDKKVAFYRCCGLDFFEALTYRYNRLQIPTKAKAAKWKTREIKNKKNYLNQLLAEVDHYSIRQIDLPNGNKSLGLYKPGSPKPEYSFKKHESGSVSLTKVINFGGIEVLFLVGVNREKLSAYKLGENGAYEELYFVRIHDKIEINSIVKLDETHVLFGLEDGKIATWKLPNLNSPTVWGKYCKAYSVSGQSIINMVVIPRNDEKHIYVRCRDNNKIWVLSSKHGEILQVLSPCNSGQISCMSELNGYLLVGYNDGFLLVLSYGRVVKKFQIYPNEEIAKIVPINDKFYTVNESRTKVMEFSLPK